MEHDPDERKHGPDERHHGADPHDQRCPHGGVRPVEAFFFLTPFSSMSERGHSLSDALDLVENVSQTSVLTSN